MSAKISTLFIIAIYAFVHTQGAEEHAEEPNKVSVSVFYESLCPDSKKFFTSQLYPSLQGNLSRYINLTLVPFGKAKQVGGDQTEFECHHGPRECTGNKIHGCAIHLIDGGNNTEDLGYNKITLGFINCLMDKVEKNGTDFPTKDCAELNKVYNLMDINNCAIHADGSKYLSEFGNATGELKSVPTITFNDKFDAEDDKLAQKNFVQALCKHITGEKPNICNSATTFFLSTFLMLATFSINYLF